MTPDDYRAALKAKDRLVVRMVARPGGAGVLLRRALRAATLAVELKVPHGCVITPMRLGGRNTEPFKQRRNCCDLQECHVTTAPCGAGSRCAQP